MAETQQDMQRLVVSLEARLQNFDKAMAKLRGDTDRTLLQVERRFATSEAKVEQFGKGFGKGFGFAERGGTIFSLVGLAIAKALRDMDKLNDRAKKVGLDMDESFGLAADRFHDKWADQIEAWTILFESGIGKVAMGIDKLSDFVDKRLIQVLRNSDLIPQEWIDKIEQVLELQVKLNQVSNEAAKANKAAYDPAVIDAYKKALIPLQELQNEFIKKQKEAAEVSQGFTSDLQDFTDKVITNFHDIGTAARELGQTLLREFVHAGLFGTGPFAPLFGTQAGGPQAGGLIGGLVSQLTNRVMIGGGPAVAAKPGFESLAPGAVEGVGGVLFPGSKKDQSQVLGGGVPSVQTGPKATTVFPPKNQVLGSQGSDMLGGGAGSDALYSVMPASAPIGIFVKTNREKIQLRAPDRPPATLTPQDMPVTSELRQNLGLGYFNDTGRIHAPGQYPESGIKRDFSDFSEREVSKEIVKNAQEVNRAMKRSAEIVKETARTSAPAISQGIAKIASSLSGNWGNAGGFPILNSVFGSFASIGGAYEHSIPFGGAMAEGGDINPGSAYLVGENGPEMIRPRFPGTVEPMGGSGGLAVHVTPSKYFDVHVERISARGNARTLNVARRNYPSTAARFSKLGTV